MFVLIQLKDSCYYDDDFEYEPFLVDASGEDFEQKYEGLKEIANNYSDFQEVEDYIDENFVRVDVDVRNIHI